MAQDNYPNVELPLAESSVIIEVPKVKIVDKIIDYDEIEYEDVEVERIVEIPVVQEVIVEKDVPVPKYVKKPVPNIIKKKENFDIRRNIPSPYETIIESQITIQEIQPKYKTETYDIIIPRYIECPIPFELIKNTEQYENVIEKVNSIVKNKETPSLSEIEEVTKCATELNLPSVIDKATTKLLVVDAIKAGKIAIN